MVLAAVFCAMVFTMTWIAIPTPSFGNINLGDCMVILSACFLGGSYAVFAGGIGAALCDIASGYAIYAPGTFFIKGLMVVVILLLRKLVLKSDKNISLIISGACAELVMAIGYFTYESLVLGYGLGAIVNVPFNLIQGLANLVAAVFLFAVMKRAGIVKAITENKKS